MATQVNKSNQFPIYIFVLLPLAILATLVLSYLFLTQCLTQTQVFKDFSETADAKVLGVKSFDLSASSTKVKDNETVTYIATVTTDNNDLGVVTSSIVFNLTGEGRIGQTIEGPGICTRASELRASCTAVNLPANQTITWKVPVTAKSTCSQSAIPTLTMVATQQATGNTPTTSEDTAIVTCISGSGTQGNGGGTGSTTGTTSGDNAPTGTTNTGNKGSLNSQDIFGVLKLHNDQVLACFIDKSLYTAAVLLLILLGSIFMYFTMMRKQKDRRR